MSMIFGTKYLKKKKEETLCINTVSYELNTQYSKHFTSF